MAVLRQCSRTVSAWEISMPEAAKKKATYEDLYTIADHMIGEIIAGELIATPRPSRRHSSTLARLTSNILPPFEYGRGGPGGWIILVEPEIALGENILVPDLAGWKRERFPFQEETNWISVAPDWVCEILSPTTLRLDKVKKMPVYAQFGVGHIWLIDPLAMTLDAFRLEAHRWVLLGSYAERDHVRLEPFQEIEIALGDLWLDTLEQAQS